MWKKSSINCPIHGQKSSRTQVNQHNSSFNTQYLEVKNINNHSSYGKDTTHIKYNSSSLYKSNMDRSTNNNIKSNNLGKYSTINYSNYNNNISLSNAYKSSVNNPTKTYGNKNSNYNIKNIPKNKPISIKNIPKPIKINTQGTNIKKYQWNKVINTNKKNNNNKSQSKGGSSSYRRRNENNSLNLPKKIKTPDRIYNKSRKNNYSYDINNISDNNMKYNSKTSHNNPISNVVVPRKDTNKNNNRIREYSSKTNDIINKRIITNESQEYKEENNDSTIVNTTDLNNYKFYVSGDYLNRNKNRVFYNPYTQPSLKFKSEYNSNNPNFNHVNTEYYNNYNYNSNSYYDNTEYNDYNEYMNENINDEYEVSYDYQDNAQILKYDKSSPLIKPYYNIQDNIIQTVPNIPRKYNKMKIPFNKSNREYINLNKKRKKNMKYKLHNLKELRENEFKIEKTKKNKKDNDNVEEHVEKYFDKNGNCIGGKKIIIKQIYDNGQKIIKKLVKEKYKSNSGYEMLKRQGDMNYNNSHKKYGKKETYIVPSKHSPNYNILEDNNEEEINVNEIVTFGVNSKNSKLDEEIIDNKDEKEADEQKIEINSEFDDEEGEKIIEDKNKKVEKNEKDIDNIINKENNNNKKEEKEKINIENENNIENNEENKNNKQNGGIIAETKNIKIEIKENDNQEFIDENNIDNNK